MLAAKHSYIHSHVTNVYSIFRFTPQIYKNFLKTDEKLSNLFSKSANCRTKKEITDTLSQSP